MLLKALTHFAHNFFYTVGQPGYWHISGETYWNYRLCVEGFLVVAISAIMGACSVLLTMPLMTAFTLQLGVLAILVLGLLELGRLVRLRREQIDFAELFYG